MKTSSTGLADWLQRAALDESVSSARYPSSARSARPQDDADLPEAARAARRLAAGRTAVPLVATRPVLVVDGRLVSVGFSYEGTLLLDRAGWADRPGTTP